MAKKCNHDIGMYGAIIITVDNKDKIRKQFNQAVDEFRTSHEAVPHPGLIVWFKYCPKCGVKLPLVLGE